MNIGPLDKKCRVEYRNVARDATYGTETITWPPLGVRWCGVQDELPSLPSRSEAVKQGVATVTQRTRVRMNYCTDIDSSMRLVIMRPEPIIYQIVSGPAELGDKQGIEMMCERYTP